MKALVILLPLLGVTWVIGLLAVNPYTTVFSWIFLFLNAFQVSPGRQLEGGGVSCSFEFVLDKANCMLLLLFTGCLHLLLPRGEA